MNKKSLITMLVALCLVAAVGVGATLAYFTDKDTKTNIVTMGKVDIDLDESSNTDEGWTAGTYNEETKGYDYSALVPNQKISKIVDVVVAEDSQPCFIRIKPVITWNGDADADLPVITLANLQADVFSSEDGTKVWSFNSADGYYYYSAECEAGERINFINSLVVPNWGNEVALKGFSIELQAEAIQADYSYDVITYGPMNRVTAWNLGDAQVEKYNAPVAVVADEEQP